MTNGSRKRKGRRRKDKCGMPDYKKSDNTNAVANLPEREAAGGHNE